MKVNLAYGRDGLWVDFPAEQTTVIEPTFIDPLFEQRAAIRNAMRSPLNASPLHDIISTGETVAISVCDSTRPMPSRTVLPVILDELFHIPPADIVILVATGSHRPTTRTELIEMLGTDIVDNYRVVNHDAFDRTTLIELPDVTPNVPVALCREWVEADRRITTGFVEPHFFAGFSGGPKMVAPGLAGFDTTMRLHDAQMIGDPNARWGVTVGNPIHDAIRRIALASGVDFSIDVAINRRREITAVRAGELFSVHETMRRIVETSAMQAFETPFDVVVTTNSGYPLDQNLYQTVKGLSAAAQVVKDGGTIICASECSDGIPAHGEYGKILAERETPEKLLEMICSPGHNRHDQWEVQIQAQIQRRAEVLLKTDGLTDDEVRATHLTPIDDVGAAARDRLDRRGPRARLCVLPDGPQTIPFLR